MLFLPLLLGGCDESLPPREDPVRVLRGSLHGITHDVQYDSLEMFNGGIPFGISVENLYEEPLQDEALIRGTLEVTLLTNPPLQGEIEIGARDLDNPWVLSGGLLTLGVDSGAMLSPHWSHEAPSGTPVWRHLDLREMMSPKGELYFQSDSVDVVVQGSIQIFKNVQPLRLGPIRWTFVYTIFHVSTDPNGVEKALTVLRQAGTGAPGPAVPEKRDTDP